MSEKRSAVEVLRVLVERVRLIEKEAAKVAAVMERMIESAGVKQRENSEATTSGHPPSG
jgi:hypothetical protein